VDFSDLVQSAGGENLFHKAVGLIGKRLFPWPGVEGDPPVEKEGVLFFYL